MKTGICRKCGSRDVVILPEKKGEPYRMARHFTPDNRWCDDGANTIVVPSTVMDESFERRMHASNVGV